eukprot:gene4742-6653_t
MGNCNFNDKYAPDSAKNKGSIGMLDTTNPVHQGSVLGIASISDENREKTNIISCSDDTSIAVSNRLELLTNKSYSSNYMYGHSKAVNRVIIDNDKNYIWTASRDLSLKKWDLRNSTESQVTFSNAHSLNISSITMSPGDSSKVFSGSRDYTVKGWDVESGSCIAEFSAPRNIVTCMQFGMSNQNYLYQGSEDLCIRTWDIRDSSRQPVVHITGYIYFPLCMDIHDNGYLLATGCKGFNSVGCEVKLWDFRNTSQAICDYKGHSQDVTGCKFSKQQLSNETGLLYSCSKDGTIFAWDWKATGNKTQDNVIDSFQTSGKNLSCMALTESIANEEVPKKSSQKVVESLVMGSIDGSILISSLYERTKLNSKKETNQSTSSVDYELQLDFVSKERFSEDIEDSDI